MRKIIVLILILTIISTLTGCYDSREIDDLAYVSVLGLDKGKNNELLMTAQFMIPTSIGGEAGNSESTYITTVETPAIYSGLSMINNLVSKQVELSHAILCIFSKELAEEGVQIYVNALSRSRGFRGNMYIVVSRESAKEFIESIQPVLEVNPTKFVSLMMSTYKYTGFSAPTTFIDFYLRNKCTCTQAVATMVAVNKYGSIDEFDLENSTYDKKGHDRPMEGDFMAGYTPQVGKTKSEAMGLAIFDGGRMVGEIDGGLTVFYLMLRDEFGKSNMTLQDPLSKNDKIILTLSHSKPPEINVSMENDNPFIKVKVNLEADILSIQSGLNYESVDNVSILETHAEDFIKKEITRFLEKTIALKSDICGFGRELKKKCLTWEEWEQVEWLKNYKNSSFDVSVELEIRRPGLILKTTPGYSTEGEVMK